MADLVTQPYLAAALADYQLTANQLAQLPALAASASRLIRDWCNRRFTRQTLDELYTLDPGSLLILRESPVNAVLRLAADPTAVFTVTQSYTATNQRATAALATSGDAYAGLVVTGLTLTRVASGVTTSQTFSFATYTTLQSLAAALASYGQGWSATIASGYSLWPTADFRGPQGARPALAPSSAGLEIHVRDLAFEADEATGMVRIHEGGSGDTDPWTSPSWGPSLDTSFGDPSIRGGFLSVRCVYDAGFDTTPESVQQATAELAKAMLERLKTDSTLAGESDGTYRWDGRAMIDALPESVRQTLALYRSTRA